VFQAAAVDNGTSSAMEAGQEAANREVASATLSPSVFEGLGKGFLRGIWVDGLSPDTLLEEIIVTHSPGVGQVVGKAAAAMEARCGCIYGVNDSSCEGFKTLIGGI